MALYKSNPPASLLGLALEGRQLEGMIVQRSNGSLRITQTFRTTLTLDPLTNDPELVGREIRNHLEEAGIRERHCTVCVPLPWALTMQAKVPDLPESDVPGFLQLEAERGFPYAPDDLAISNSCYSTPNGERYATLVAIPKTHVTGLEKALRAAHLKPLSFSLGIAALQEHYDQGQAGQLTVAIGETCIELQVSANGGIAALRALEGAFEAEGPAKRVDADLLAREIRITLGQLPKALRDSVNRMRVFGPAEVAGLFIKEMTPLARPMGLLVEPGIAPRVNGSDSQAVGPGASAATLGLVSRLLQGAKPSFEFLPPRLSPLAHVITRFSSAKVVYAGATAGAIVLMVILAFLVQQWRLSTRESRWLVLRSKVSELKTLQEQERKFRSWYDESFKAMQILRGLTEAFPADGVVWARTLKIRDLSEVTCMGNSRDDPALLRLQDQLRKIPQIADLKVPQSSGSKSPIQFNLTFRWSEGANP